jgi:hypothetical protein
MQQRRNGRLQMSGAALIVAVLVGRLCLDSSTGGRVLRETGPMMLVLFFATAVVAAFAATGLPHGEPRVARARRRLRCIKHTDTAKAAGQPKRHEAPERSRIFLN